VRRNRAGICYLLREELSDVPWSWSNDILGDDFGNDPQSPVNGWKTKDLSRCPINSVVSIDLIRPLADAG